MIGYYVHHQGLGHLTRARCVAAALSEPVTVLSSRPAGPGPFADRVDLPRDDDADDPGVDHDAGGALHWAPRDAAGYTARMARLADWVRDARPSTVVVDASVEVAVLVRTLGVPVVVVAAPGRRDDPPHRLVHRLASRIVAPWTADVLDPPHLHPWADRTVHCGALSRFDGRRPAVPPGGREVLVLVGAGGSAVGTGDLDAARRATPGWRWRALGVDGWADPATVWAHLEACDVVVCHGGQNALAEVAAARRPAVVVPQQRPFDEQHVTAAALDAAGIAVAAPTRPDPDRWPALLASAAERGGAGWARWSLGDGAERAAAAIASVTADRREAVG